MTTPRLALLLLSLTALATTANAQAKHAASRAADIQLGAGYTTANADYEYTPNRIAGLFLYTDIDFKENLGISATAHFLNDPNSAVYERTIELGPRYIRHYYLAGLTLNPYAKLQGGVGILNFPKYANLGYTMLSGAAGLDIALRPRLNLRAEFEYQDWLSAPGPNLHMTPTLLSIGAAYHFDAGKARR